MMQARMLMGLMDVYLLVIDPVGPDHFYQHIRDFYNRRPIGAFLNRSFPVIGSPLAAFRRPILVQQLMIAECVP